MTRSTTGPGTPKAARRTTDLTVPFGVGTETIGEQGIRVGAGLELEAGGFFFGWGGLGLANALRSETFTVTGGESLVDWDASNGNLEAYFSQDGGTTWTAISDGVAFDVDAGTYEVLFVGNDGVDSNTALNSVAITLPVPEPHSIAVWCLFGLVGTAVAVLRRQRRAT